MDLDDLNMEKERIKDAKTLKGKYFNLMGYIFAGLCIYKVVTVRSRLAAFVMIILMVANPGVILLSQH